jgi:hypothetical protein
MANKVTVSATGDKELEALLAQLPVLVVAKGGPTDKAVRKAGAIVRTRARQLVPRGRKTGTRKKQSKKSKAIWDRELHTQVASKVVRYPKHSVAVIGAKSPYGNHANFNQEKPRKLVLWGKATRVNPYRALRNWITQAFDETRSQQHTAMTQVLRKEIDENMRG